MIAILEPEDFDALGKGIVGYFVLGSKLVASPLADQGRSAQLGEVLRAPFVL